MPKAKAHKAWKNPWPVASRQLAASDPIVRELIRQHGPCKLRPEPHLDPFESLARAVAHQQLNGRAANTILTRFIALFPGVKFPKPEQLERVSDEKFRAVGFSFNKIASLRDIASKCQSGVIPSSREISHLEDEEIIERLTEARGVGRWTVQMLLIFKLARPDVLPVDDFGVRNGFRFVHGLPEMPKPKIVHAHGERWMPYRTLVSWYLWREADRVTALKKTETPPPKMKKAK